MNLSNCKVQSKVAEFSYPSFPEFKVKLAHLPRTQQKAIVERNTKLVWKRGRQTEELDPKSFYPEYVKAVFKDWEGLTMDIVRHLVPVDDDSTPGDTEIDFSIENARFLVENSAEFDQWTTEMQSNLQNFVQDKLSEAEKN